MEFATRKRKEFQSFKITDEDPLSELLTDRTQNIHVTAILKYKNVRRSIDLLRLNDPPNLTHVGDQLAFQVVVIYRASIQDFRKAEEECDSQDFASNFHFDRRKFQNLRVNLSFNLSIILIIPLQDPYVDLNQKGNIVCHSTSRHSAEVKEKYFSQYLPSQLYFANNKF